MDRTLGRKIIIPVILMVIMSCLFFAAGSADAATLKSAQMKDTDTTAVLSGNYFWIESSGKTANLMYSTEGMKTNGKAIYPLPDKKAWTHEFATDGKKIYMTIGLSSKTSDKALLQLNPETSEVKEITRANGIHIMSVYGSSVVVSTYDLKTYTFNMAVYNGNGETTKTISNIRDSFKTTNSKYVPYLNSTGTVKMLNVSTKKSTTIAKSSSFKTDDCLNTTSTKIYFSKTLSSGKHGIYKRSYTSTKLTKLTTIAKGTDIDKITSKYVYYSKVDPNNPMRATCKRKTISTGKIKTYASADLYRKDL